MHMTTFTPGTQKEEKKVASTGAKIAFISVFSALITVLTIVSIPMPQPLAEITLAPAVYLALGYLVDRKSAFTATAIGSFLGETYNLFTRPGYLPIYPFGMVWARGPEVLIVSLARGKSLKFAGLMMVLATVYETLAFLIPDGLFYSYGLFGYGSPVGLTQGFLAAISDVGTLIDLVFVPIALEIIKHGKHLYVYSDHMDAELGKLFGTNGIRGIPGKDLLPETIGKVAFSVAKKLGKRVAIGRDGRNSSVMLSSLLSSYLLSCGADVYDLGMLPTPAFQYYISRDGFDAGIMVTASHNPPEFNGLKVMGRNGVEIPRQTEEEIEAFVFSLKNFEYASEPGQYFTVNHAIDKYIEGIISQVGKKKRGLRVLVDAGNGMQSLAAPNLLEQLGCEVKCINCNVDGSFPGRGPEPIPSKLKELSDEVQNG